MSSSVKNTGVIRAGIGGWIFPPWRGTFYPHKLKQSEELAFASRRIPAIEINGTYYRTQKPSTFEAWARETPPGFVFSVKGPRYATNRRMLAEASDSIARFMDSGVTRLGRNLGPIVWQFSPSKSFDEVDFGRFLECLPQTFDRRQIRHVVEVRHPSFATPALIDLLRHYNVSVVYADHAKYPAIPDLTGDVVYLRLMRADDKLPAGYSPREIALWADRAKSWAEGHAPAHLPLVDHTDAVHKPRDVFVFFIHEGKVRAPAAAEAFMRAVSAASAAGNDPRILPQWSRSR